MVKNKSTIERPFIISHISLVKWIGKIGLYKRQPAPKYHNVALFSYFLYKQKVRKPNVAQHTQRKSTKYEYGKSGNNAIIRKTEQINWGIKIFFIDII